MPDIFDEIDAEAKQRQAQEEVRQPDIFDSIDAETGEQQQTGNFRQRMAGALTRGLMGASKGIRYLPKHMGEMLETGKKHHAGPSYMPPGYDHSKTPSGKVTASVKAWYQGALDREDALVQRMFDRHPEWETAPPENFLALVSSPDKLAIAVTEALPLLVVAGLATAAGQPAVAATLILGAEGQSAYDQAIADGQTEEMAEKAFFTYGPVAVGLEMMRLKGILKLGKKAHAEVMKKAVGKLGKFRNITKATLKEAINEALEEQSQGTWGEATSYILYGKEIEGGWKGFLDRRMQEGLIAGTMAGGSAVGGASMAMLSNGKKKASAKDVSERLGGIERAIKNDKNLSDEQKTEMLGELQQVTDGIMNGEFDVMPDRNVATATPEKQIDAAETTADTVVEAVAVTKTAAEAERAELTDLYLEGDEDAGKRIEEMDAEEILEEELPSYESLFAKVVETGDAVAVNAILNGEYKGGRSRNEALQATADGGDVLQKVYSKGFVAKLTSIRNSADNMVAGAGDKKSQVRVMKSELAKIQEHYDSISEDIKNNPELLKELSAIEKLLPEYSKAVNDFTKSPSEANFGKVKEVGDKIGELSNKYGSRVPVGRVDPTVSPTEDRAKKFASVRVHSIAKTMGMATKDRRKIQVDLVGKKSMKDMTLDEAKKVEAYFVAEAKKRGLVTSLGIELADFVKGEVTQKSHEESTGTTPAAWKRIMGGPGRVIEHFLEGSKRVERLIFGMDGFTEGPIYNSIWRPVIGAAVQSRMSHNERVAKFREALADIMAPELNTEEGLQAAQESIAAEDAAAGKKARKLTKRAIRKLVGASLWAKYITGGKSVIIEATATEPELRLSPSEKIGAFLAMKNEDSLNHLRKGNLKDFDNPDAALIKIIDSITPQERAIADWILKDLEVNFERANQASVIGLGRPLEQQDSYFPIKVIDTADMKQEDFLGQLENKYTKEEFQDKPSEVNKRVKGASQTIKLDAFGVYLNHLSRIEQFIHMAPVAKSVGNIVNTQEFRQATNRVTAGHGAGILSKWLKNSIKGHAIEQTGLYAKTLLIMRQKGVLFSLTGNLPSVARQFISGFNYVAMHPMLAVNTAKYMTISADPRVFKQLETRMKKNSDMMVTRNFEREVANAKHQAQVARVLTGQEEFSNKALSWQRWADNRTTTIVWNSAYDAALHSESAQKQFKLDGSEEAAAYFADKMVMRTQPMGDVEHLPDFFTGGPIERLLTTFQNQVNNNFNFWAHDIVGEYKAGNIDKKMVAWRALFSYILPSQMFGAISRGGLPDDWKDSLFDVAVYGLGPIFLIGRIFQDALLGFAGGQTSVEDILPSNFAKGLQSGVKAITSEGEERKEAAKKSVWYNLKTVGGLTGLGPNALFRTAIGIRDIYTGETDDLRRLIYSDWSLSNYGWPGDEEEKSKTKRMTF